MPANRTKEIDRDEKDPVAQTQGKNLRHNASLRPPGPLAKTRGHANPDCSYTLDNLGADFS